ncbi:hypothetical protein [Luteipulveratus mongoliensis]|uniref:hypothetical protein n=1 Tax=Luteipulveratus mongoliensis TaxID=571913 RepID=UPI001C54DCC7|nr:hypothetical protein [Luteipulveratus mongoliensis]
MPWDDWWIAPWTSSPQGIILLAITVSQLIMFPVIGGVLVSAGGRYYLGLLWFSVTRQLPWNLLELLSRANDSGLLRRFGMTYRFRHARVRETLRR